MTERTAHLRDDNTGDELGGIMSNPWHVYLGQAEDHEPNINHT